jgi:hypothetical protein
MHIGLDGAHRTVHDEFHTDRCRQMENHIGAVHQFADQGFVKDGIDAV